MLLAKNFGRVDVDAFMDELTAEAVDEWIAFFTLETEGDREADDKSLERFH